MAILVTATAFAAASAALSLPAAAAATPKAPAPKTAHLAPVSHPQDDRAGSTIAAHEGRGSVAKPGQATPSGALLVGATTQTPGMDVSHYQGNVAWGTAYANGARFAYLKATESTTYTDPTFATNYAGASYAGMVRGAYHFALPDRSSGTAQADYLLAHGGGIPNDGMALPPMLDMEYNPYGATCYGLSATSMVLWIRAFSDEIHARTKRYPTIYTTTDWWTTCTGNNPTFGATNPLVIARYNTTVGTLPAGWSAYTMWQYADAGTFPGDQDKYNGTVTQLQAFARGCPPGDVVSSLLPSGMTYDFSRDGHPDVVSRSTDGMLRIYSSTGTGTGLAAPTVVGCGWNGMTAIFSPGDFNSDGYADLVARTSTGDLLLYFWDGTRFSRSLRLGSGWGGFTALFSSGDFNGDRRPDIIGRTSAGTLLMYAGTGSGLSAPKVIGTGWNGITALLSNGDFNADGHTDVIGRTSAGTLLLYTGTGTTVALNSPRVIGTGWQGMTGFDGNNDFNGDKHADLIARTSSGTLLLYRGNGVGFVSTTTLGTGWNAATALT